MKRLCDIVFSLAALIVFAPVILSAAILIWLQDGHNPFYTPTRVGYKGRTFRLFKLRSMTVGADRSKVDTTTDLDTRITKLGRHIRKYKIDELPQFLNVLWGQMSLVGPRPNIDREVNLYSNEERRMLFLRPGITDLSSIIFSDLGHVLAHAENANLAYNQLIRPWKSRLALIYLEHRNFQMDMTIMWLTAIAIFSSDRARSGVVKILVNLEACSELISIARRDVALYPAPPPGLDEIVTAR